MPRLPARFPLFVRAILLLLLPEFLIIASSTATKKTEEFATARWTAAAEGSTFSQTADGKYVYGLQNGDIAMSITVDSQELEKVRHRPVPIFAVRADVRYKGQQSVELTTNRIGLEFLTHYQVVARALDPDELGTRIQTDIDNLTDEIERDVRKHPDKRQQQESLLQAHLKDMTDLLGFISLYGLRDTTLDPGNYSVGGWVFFDAKNKWIGKWKSQESFILRVTAGDRIFEFPFELPPRKGDVILRRSEH